MANWTRRDLSLGLMASSLWAAAPPSLVKLPKKVRLVLLGTLGHVGEVLKPLPQLPEIEITAYCEADKSELAKVLKNPALAKAKAYSDYQKMLDAEKPDIVAVCTSNGDRAEAIRACCRRKLPFIAEKPFATTLTEYVNVEKQIVDAGIQPGILLPLRFDPPYLAIHQIVKSGAIGEVGQISSQKSYKAGERPAWMRDYKTYGGTIPWIGIHMIDLMRFTSGREFAEVASYQSQVLPPASIGAMENTTGTIFRMDNGGVASLHMDYYRPDSAATHGDDRIRLAGPKGVVEYLEATGVTLLVEGRKQEKITDLPAQRQVFVDYLEALYNGKKPLISRDDMFRSNRATLAAHQAAVEKRFVRVV